MRASSTSYRIDEFLEKMRYALEARNDPNFLIIGRTDSFTAVEGDMDDAIQRGNALRDLGVDVVMPRGVRQREDLATFRAGVPDVPLLVIAGTDDITVQEYEELGYKVIIYATTPAIAAVEGIQRAYTNLRDTGHIGIGAADVGDPARGSGSVDQPARIPGGGGGHHGERVPGSCRPPLTSAVHVDLDHDKGQGVGLALIPCRVVGHTPSE